MGASHEVVRGTVKFEGEVDGVLRQFPDGIAVDVGVATKDEVDDEHHRGLAD